MRQTARCVHCNELLGIDELMEHAHTCKRPGGGHSFREMEDSPRAAEAAETLTLAPLALDKIAAPARPCSSRRSSTNSTSSDDGDDVSDAACSPYFGSGAPPPDRAAGAHDTDDRISLARDAMTPPPGGHDALSPRLQPPATDGARGGGGGGGREHRDADYGHQDGEVNFWLPLTDPERTRTTLWAESAPGAGDFHPLDVAQGEIAAFHGTRCRHRAPPNESSCARVSLDFRVGVGEYFDPRWQLPGAKAQHTRREVTLPGLVC